MSSINHPNPQSLGNNDLSINDDINRVSSAIKKAKSTRYTIQRMVTQIPRIRRQIDLSESDLTTMINRLKPVLALLYKEQEQGHAFLSNLQRKLSEPKTSPVCQSDAGQSGNHQVRTTKRVA